MTPRKLDELVLDAGAHNAMHGVTGVLLYDVWRFFQYFEGPEDGVRQVFKRIEASRTHRDLEVKFHGRTQGRYFPHWLMASRRAQPGTILQLGTTRWQLAMRSLPHESEQPPAIQALVAFWNRAAPSVEVPTTP